jgi:outer membrane immunogenic protein
MMRKARKVPHSVTAVVKTGAGEMKNYILGLLAGTAVAFTASFAVAADMPTKAPYSPVPVTNWSGFYVGVNAGGAFGQFTDAVGGTANASGFVGGGQIGVNWQIQQLVLGIEGDFQGTSQKATQTGVILGIPVSASESMPWFGTVRGRIGYAWNNVLLYGTGGVAFSNVDVSATALGLTVSGNNTATGFAAGGGGEWMFAPKWSAKLEYLYLDTGNTTVTVGGVGPVTGKFQDNIVRVGLNYHF